MAYIYGVKLAPKIQKKGDTMKLFRIINNSYEFGLNPTYVEDDFYALCATDRKNVLTWATILSRVDKEQPFSLAEDKEFVVVEFSYSEKVPVFASTNAEWRTMMAWDIHNEEMLSSDELKEVDMMGGVEYDIQCHDYHGFEVKSYYKFDREIVDKAKDVVNLDISFNDVKVEGASFEENYKRHKEAVFGGLRDFGDILTPISEEEARAIHKRIRASKPVLF